MKNTIQFYFKGGKYVLVKVFGNHGEEVASLLMYKEELQRKLMIDGVIKVGSVEVYNYEADYFTSNILCGFCSKTDNIVFFIDKYSGYNEVMASIGIEY